MGAGVHEECLAGDRYEVERHGGEGVRDIVLGGKTPKARDRCDALEVPGRVGGGDDVHVVRVGTRASLPIAQTPTEPPRARSHPDTIEIGQQRHHPSRSKAQSRMRGRLSGVRRMASVF